MKRRFKLLQALLKNNKFRVSFLKYFAGAASTALVAFAVYGLISYNLYSMYLRDALSQYRERNLYKTSGFIDLVLEGADQAFYIISNDENIQKMLITPADKLPDAVTPPEEPEIKKSDVSRIISDLFLETVLSPAMHSIYLYSAENDHLVTWTDFRPRETFFDPEVLSYTGRDDVLFARELDTGPLPARVITLVREIVLDGEPAGLAVFNFNHEQFGSHVSQDFESLPETVCVADKAGRIFYATDPGLLNAAVQEQPLYRDSFAGAAQSGSGIAFGDGRVVTAVRAASGRYTVFSNVEAADIARFQRDFLSFALWASMAGLLLAFFLAFGISYRLYRNVIRLVSFIGTPSGAGSEADARGELNYITGSITGLTARNRHIEHELAEKLAELKKAQAIALQNQINPHFILNTLQIVNLDVLKHLRSDSNATRIIALLSDILQANLNITDHLVPLSFELRQAVKYIEIENIRNKERFLVDWEIDEELTEYRTVKFVLQPLLENSFKHGLMNSGREKRVSVRAWLEDKTLVISVRDNGLGMAPDALDNLRQRLRKSHIQENRHIGLCNVDKRIRLVFGDAYGVSVESTSGEGTLVMIRQKPVRGDWSEG